MWVGAAVDVERLWIGEHLFVAVGGRVVHRHLVAGSDAGAREFGVRQRGPPEAVDRIVIANDFFDRPRDQGGVRTQLGQLLRVPDQAQKPRREHPFRRVVTRDYQKHEEAAEVDIAHRRAAASPIPYMANSMVAAPASPSAPTSSGSWFELMRSDNTWMWSQSSGG